MLLLLKGTMSGLVAISRRGYLQNIQNITIKNVLPMMPNLRDSQGVRLVL